MVPAKGKTVKIPRASQGLRPNDLRPVLRNGVNVKLVSKWQGHQDGGKLILDTYSDIISDSDKAFERQELEKLVV